MRPLPQARRSRHGCHEVGRRFVATKLTWTLSPRLVAAASANVCDRANSSASARPTDEFRPIPAAVAPFTRMPNACARRAISVPNTSRPRHLRIDHVEHYGNVSDGMAPLLLVGAIAKRGGGQIMVTPAQSLGHCVARIPHSAERGAAGRGGRLLQ